MKIIASTLGLAAALLCAPPASAQPVNRPVAALSATLSGQPVPAPAAPLVVQVNELTIPAGEILPPHKHAYLRVVEILAGELEVRYPDTGETKVVRKGDWVVDSVDAWHTAAVLGTAPVVMRVIDILPPGAPATILRSPNP